METEHLTKALLEQSDSLVKRILEKAGADAAEALRSTQRFIDRQPRVSGTATQVLGRNLEALVDAARKHRDAATDECVRCAVSALLLLAFALLCAALTAARRFVSSEHLLLALAKDARFGSGAALLY